MERRIGEFRGGEVWRCPRSQLIKEGGACLPFSVLDSLAFSFVSLSNFMMQFSAVYRLAFLYSVHLGIRYVFYLRTIYKSKQKLAINSLYTCGYKKPEIPLGSIDKTWHLSYSYDDFSKLYDRGKQLAKWVHRKVKVI